FGRASAIASEVLVVSGSNEPSERQVAQRLVASLPNARLRIADLFPKALEFAVVIDEFLGEWETPVRDAGPPIQSSLRTILFTDIESHTQMMQRLGDAKGREVLREHERITREALAAHGGAEVK